MRWKAKLLICVWLSCVVFLFDCLFVVWLVWGVFVYLFACVCVCACVRACVFVSVCVYVCVCGGGGGGFVFVVYSGHACSVSFKPMIIGCHYRNVSIKY